MIGLCFVVGAGLGSMINFVGCVGGGGGVSLMWLVVLDQKIWPR